MQERYIKAVYETGPGVSMFMDVGGAGTYPVARIIGETGPGVELGFFVNESSPGVELVNVIAGHEFIRGGPQQQQMQQKREDMFTAAIRDGAADLSPSQHAAVQELDVAFRAVVDDADDLVACLRLRDVVLRATSESWPSGVWLEDVVRQGIYCGHILVVKHQRYEEALPMIKRVFGVVLEQRWMDGGPYGRVETQDARECSRLIAVCESNLRPPAPSPAARPHVPEPPKKRGFFDRFK